MSDWWEQLERSLEERSEDAPDPWAHLSAVDESDSGLTAEQEAFLRQVSEQPHPGRFHDD